ncbi:MAG: O-antigen ligase family protein [Acidimicrobiales bacterium]
MISLLLKWRAQAVLLLVAALAPYDGLLIIAPLPGVVGLWKEALVFGAAGLAWYQRRGAPSWREEPRQIPLWAGASIVLTGLAVFSALTVASSQALFGFKIGYFYLLIPLALWWTPMTSDDRDRLVSVLMANGVITSVVGLVQQILGGDRLHALGYEWNETIRYSGGLLRSFSTFNQPFPFGYFLAIVLLVAVPVALGERSRRRNRWFLLASPLLVIAVATTVVRGAILALVVGAAYLAVQRPALRRVVVSLPLLVGLAFFVDVSSYLSLDSLADRLSGWGIEVVQSGVEPLGRGIGSTGAAAERYHAAVGLSAYPDRPLGDRYQPDNHYVKMLVELGPLGLWLFVTMLVGAVRSSTRRRDACRREAALASDAATAQRAQRDADLAVGVTASTIGAMAAAVVATYWEIFPADLYFWILIGAVSCTSRSTVPPGPTTERASPASSSTPSRSAPAAAACRPMAASSSATSPR